LDLRLIVRVTQFSVQEKVEILVQAQLFISHFDVLVTSFLDHSSSIDWLKHSVDRVIQVFNQNWVSLFDSSFNCPDKLGVT